MIEARRPDLLANMVDFSFRLRSHGLLVSPAQSIDGLRALAAIDLTDRQEFYLSLRTVMASRQEDLPIFDEVFHSFWPALLADVARDDAEDQLEMPAASQVGNDGSDDAGQEDQSSQVDAAGEGDAEEQEDVAGYSANESLAGKDFSLFRADEMEEMVRVTLMLARRMATRLSRRMRPARHSPLIDRRRTLRLNLKYGGDVIELAHKRRKIKRTKLVLLCDVSGSMDIYSRFLLQFIYALQSTFARTES
ncbi:MAG: vWA domain-containing protein, partial [Chloroflexota bacterium]